MSSSNLIRWSGLAALVGGLLIAILSVSELVLFGSQPDSATMASSAWVIVESGFLVATILIILGLFGCYARHAEQIGSLGFSGFLVALTGTVLLSGLAWSTAFMASWIAAIAPAEQLNAEPAGAFVSGILLTFVLFAAGWLLFGLACMRVEGLPNAAAVLLIVGAVLSLVLGLLEFGFEMIVFGAAFAWLGYAVWSGADQPSTSAETAM